MSDLKVLEFPDDSQKTVADALRLLANRVDAGEFGTAHNAVWVIDKGNGVVDVGLLGHSREVAPLAYTLLGLGQSHVIRLIEANEQ